MTDNSESSRPRLILDDQLCFALYAATNAVTRAYKPLLGALGLTYPQYLVMLTLWQDGPLSGVRIAERLQIGANGITPLVDQLERAGFVARKREIGDRRIVMITLTDAGSRLEQAAAAAQAAVVCRTGLSSEGLSELRNELTDLVERMAALGEALEEENV